MPRTPLPLRASWDSVALPIAPRPSTMVSKRLIRVIGSRQAKAADVNPAAEAARYASGFPAPPRSRSTMLVNPQRRPARPASRSFAVDQPKLLQFVLLSMLLHVLLIVLFGNPVGGTRRGEAWWGPLDVTLRRLAPEAGSGFRPAPGAAPPARRRLDRNAPDEVDKQLTPPVVAPAPIERVAPPQIEREVAP